MQTKNLFSKESILDAYKKAFENGYMGFHLCPSNLFTGEDVKNFLNDIFEVPPEKIFFYVKSCDHNYMAIYIDPRVVDNGNDIEKYIYEGKYVFFCFDLCH